jgi:hypothetical protein
MSCSLKRWQRDTIGSGTLKWYQSIRQTFKLSSKYKGFSWQAGPLFGRTTTPARINNINTLDVRRVNCPLFSAGPESGALLFIL